MKFLKMFYPDNGDGFAVIVEEAAEVLESHIVTSLTEHCEHLILIGKLSFPVAHLSLLHMSEAVIIFLQVITSSCVLQLLCTDWQRITIWISRCLSDSYEIILRGIICR